MKEVYNPYDGSVVGTVEYLDELELGAVIQTATDVKKQAKELPSYIKANALRFIADQLLNQKIELSKLICSESGKPIRYALGEVERSAQTFYIAAEECKRLPKEYISLDWTKAGENKEGLVKHFPVGVVAGITPFNFPLNLVAHKVAPAIAAGCPIIIKPAPATPLTALALQKIVAASGLPNGMLQVVCLENNVAELLVTDLRVSMFSFTGSPNVGWMLKSKAGKKKGALELGGNAGVIITETSDLTKAIDRCIIGGFAYSGQVCIHTQRILIHNSVYDQFVKEFVSKATNLKSGDPGNDATEISVLITEESAKRVENWIEEAIKEGADKLCGGDSHGSLVSPTILTNVKSTSKVCTEEVFGPVVIVESYTSFSDAIDQINRSRYGLQAGVFSDKQSEIDYAFNELEVGGVIINDVPTFRVDHMPYGGVKDSGFGREGVKYAILEMMEPRILVK